MNEIINPQKLFDKLLSDSKILSSSGIITFSLSNVHVIINTTDTVGIILQSWVKQWLINNNIYFSEPENTQKFPDFFLNNSDKKNNILEIKAFNYDRTPAFDIANFESYCSSIAEKAYYLNADYLIFGYDMNSKGRITIKKIWLKKIWEIAGTSERFPLKTQVKRGMIYNIRPSTNFKVGKPSSFKNKEEFIKAIYGTLIKYKNNEIASNWLEKITKSYQVYFSQKLDIK
jgi:hypothetical protein